MLGSTGSGNGLENGFVEIGAEEDAARIFQLQYGLYLTDGRHIPDGFRLLGRQTPAAQPVFKAAANIPPPQGESILVGTAAGVGRSRRYARPGICGLGDR